MSGGRDEAGADAALESVVAEIDSALRAHAGGIDLVDKSEDGTATMRFTGMCAGCPMRPLTTAATVRPALLSVEGVTRVEIDGSSISEYAEQRLAKAFGGVPDCQRQLSEGRNSGGPPRP